MVWVQVMHDFNPVQLVFPLWKPVPKNLPGYMQLCSDNRRQTKRIAIAFRREWNVIGELLGEIHYLAIAGYIARTIL
jgi:hypothetical protein